ncbi:hypothetical protein E2C01_045893 [Portunus trituberculatus]|uniref:Secreted protein n=1 Tax=Portunus trituberculatus TaxID=210409 RepID=A0A5B7G461_PORTR|nr:hypothetical protein [Portunus trituberculatus]
MPTAGGPHCRAVSGKSAVVLVIRPAFAALNYLCGGDENVPAFCAFTVPSISSGRSVTDTGGATTGTRGVKEEASYEEKVVGREV